MKFVLFYHTLVSDWNHGNAHFLRGIATELLARGHQVTIFEPRNSWSRQHLVAEHGEKPIRKFRAAYPALTSRLYDPPTIDLHRELENANVVIVHEWNDHALVRSLGEHRARHRGYTLLFHDTHHRMITNPGAMAAYDLTHYDGVLAYGEVLRQLYQQSGRVRNAWTWHEAADVRVFRPLSGIGRDCDFVWIGNWGDGERTAEIDEFLVRPVSQLTLKARVYGVRYPAEARAALDAAGIEYGDWLPNFEVPRVFAASKVTVHIPRRPYVKALPGIPTIRVFEALACGIPMVCSPWDDVERLFRPGDDFLVAGDGARMRQRLSDILQDPDLAQHLARNGLETIRARHTCAHRVDALLKILRHAGDPACLQADSTPEVVP